MKMGSRQTRTRTRTHYLSVVGEDQCVSESIKLPFDASESLLIEGGRCGELLSFHEVSGKIVVFNSTTKQFKTFPPHHDDPQLEWFSFVGCGVGYDAKSQDYMLIRTFIHYPLDLDGHLNDVDAKDSAELYSFKSCIWREIESPDADCLGSNAVWVGETGRCYWLATLGRSFGIPEDLLYRDDYVLSFDFATETFAHFDLPRTASASKEKNLRFKIFECGGLLGAIGRPAGFPYPMEPVELYVRKGQLWNRLYNVSYARVDRVLGIKDDQLLVRDWVTKRWKKLVVYDYLAIVDFGLCLYVASNDLLQLRAHSKPKTRGKRKRTGTLKNKTTFELIEPLEQVELLEPEN